MSGTSQLREGCKRGVSLVERAMGKLSAEPMSAGTSRLGQVREVGTQGVGEGN